MMELKYLGKEAMSRTSDENINKTKNKRPKQNQSYDDYISFQKIKWKAPDESSKVTMHNTYSLYSHGDGTAQSNLFHSSDTKHS